MGLKLLLASWYTPERILAEMLDRVDESTTRALDELLEKQRGSASRRSPERKDPGGAAAAPCAEGGPRASLAARRASMATGHNERVEALVAAMGRGKAVEAGREALFEAGERLGREARARFGVGGGASDLERAARILYRALGIHFEIEKRGNGEMLLRVDRCALADRYSPDACEILSAADEGVMRGLNPSRRMRFRQKMTCGHATCIAIISKEDR